ncbi:MAG: hypothetical protein ACKOSS_12360 [Planctomycetia bacterium]
MLLGAACPAGPAGAHADGPLAAPAAAAPAPTRLVAPRDAATREAAWRRHGGTPEARQALERGVDWLVRHQGADGLWDADGFDARCEGEAARCTGKGRGQHGEEVPCPFDEAISGLCALALLGAGHLPGDGSAAGTALERTLPRLAATHDTWAQPLALEALAEAEVLERRGRFTPAVQRLAAALLARRQPDGAWGYAAPMRRGSDVPTTALVVPALLAARDAGVALPADLAPRVEAWLGALEEDEGRLAYLADGRAYGYTPTRDNGHAAVALRELLEAGTQGARHAAHLSLLAAHPPAWKLGFREMLVPGRGRVTVQVGHLSLYAWWYGSVGTFQRGGSAWTRWWAALRAALLPKQVAAGCARGSWPPEGTYERQTGGRVLATALAVLALEAPLRHRRLADASGR